jgi:hypothetical protein
LGRGVEPGRDLEPAGTAAAQQLDREEDDHAHDPDAAADRQRRPSTPRAAAAADIDHILSRSAASPAHAGRAYPARPRASSVRRLRAP